MQSKNVAVSFEMSKDGDHLESSSKTHLVCEDSVEANVMQRKHPGNCASGH